MVATALSHCRYRPNFTNITITISGINHCTVFYLKTRCFGEWILSPSSGRTYSDEQMEKSDLLNTGHFFRKVASTDRLCGLVVRVLGYRFGGLGSILGTTKKK
jgi:hypothetical protein